MVTGTTSGVGMGNSLIAPLLVVLPILSPSHSVNHRLPSGPDVMPVGKLTGVGTVNSVTCPWVVIRPILLACSSVNHRFAVRAGRDAPGAAVVRGHGVLGEHA